MKPDILFIEITKISITLTILIFVMLLFYRPPIKKQQHAYRKSIPAIMLSMVLIAIVNCMEIFSNHGSYDLKFIILTTQIVASFQLFLFSATIITMLDLNFFSKKRIVRELAIPTLLSLHGIFFYLFDMDLPIKVLFVIFGLYFGFQVIRYTKNYLETEKETNRKLDNFFSEEISLSLKWTRAAFIGLFFCSIFTIASFLQNQYLSVIFTICYNGYYLYFVIHFFNFINSFSDIEKALKTHAEPIGYSRNTSPSFEQLEEAITLWEKNKLYTEPGITIEQVAIQLKTNRTYLSNHMNIYRNISFKEWINGLRIEEAKRLLKENPTMPVSQIGVIVGIPDKSNFGRQFSKFNGMSPQMWRKK